jgi:hypothetical protein
VPATRKRPAPAQETAADAYARLQDEVRATLAAIHGRLDRHAERQARKPLDWGFVGDLSDVRRKLREVKRLLGLPGPTVPTVYE